MTVKGRSRSKPLKVETRSIQRKRFEHVREFKHVFRRQMIKTRGRREKGGGGTEGGRESVLTENLGFMEK